MEAQWRIFVGDESGEIDLGRSSTHLERYLDEDGLRIDMRTLPTSICALYFDHMVRHDAVHSHIQDYLAGFLGVNEGSDEENDEEVEDEE